MAIYIRNGRLLKAGGGLAAECCCNRYWCVENPEHDPCDEASAAYLCVMAASRPPNAVAGPFASADLCSCPAPPEAPACCAEDSDCPPEECCEGDQCVPCDKNCYGDEDCPAGQCCVDGECVPCSPPPPTEQWNCCWSESSGDADFRDTRPSCVQGPCLDRNGIEAPMLRAGGPYGSREQCARSCRPHDCTLSPCCGAPDCLPSDAGPHVTLDKCRDACSPPQAGQCGLDPSGTFAGAGDERLEFTINCEKDTPICVRYASLKCGPLRVQIRSDQLDPGGGCFVTAQDVIRVDSQWKGKPDCCNDPPDLAPEPDEKCSGILKWRTKQAGIISFAVVIMAPCDDNNEWEFDIQCGEDACSDPCDGRDPPCEEECNVEAGCCCVDGSPDNTKTTQAACEAAGGTWNIGAPCGGFDCRCCEAFKYICYEQVFTTYTVTNPGNIPPGPAGPAGGQAGDTIAVDVSPLVCADAAETAEIGYMSDFNCAGGLAEAGDEAPAWYFRYRAVSDCSECSSPAPDPNEICPTGVYSIWCREWDSIFIDQSLRDFLCSCGTVDLCDDIPIP